VTPPRERDDRYVDNEAEAAAREAGGIGGTAGDEDIDPAKRPLEEAGEGESEGFEEAEEELIEHARHDDQHGTSRITQDAAGFDELEESDVDYGESDEEEKEDI
jgi:hypothetical protein